MKVILTPAGFGGGGRESVSARDGEGRVERDRSRRKRGRVGRIDLIKKESERGDIGRKFGEWKSVSRGEEGKWAG